MIKVGGSLSGLMNAIVLSREGYKVQVFERSHPSQLISEAAGLGVGPNVHTFLQTYTKVHDTYGIAHTERSTYDENADLIGKLLLPYTLRMVNWTTLYNLLKDAFMNGDAVSSSVVYKTYTEVTNVLEENTRVAVHYRDLETDDQGVLHAEFVVAADGASSSVRRQLWQPESPSYAGYGLWRGRVSDQLISEATRQALQGNTLFQKLQNGYILS